MNPNTQFLMDILLEPAQALRRELGRSFDLVCVPEAEAAAKTLNVYREYAASIGPKLAASKVFPDAAEQANSNKGKTRPPYWYDPRVNTWVCSLHDRQNCQACR